MSTPAVIANRDIALRHLELLGRDDEVFTFQVWPDEGNDGIVPQVITGTLDEAWERLVAANEAGAGIGVTMQATSGGRRLEDVRSYRAVFAECDSPESVAIQPPASCLPSYLVHSSPGKCHRVWLIEPTTDREGWLAAMNQVGAFYGSDPSAVDPTRVLRLAGTLHRKRGGRVLVELASRTEAYEEPYTFTLAELIQAHPVDSERLADFAVVAGSSGSGTLRPKPEGSLTTDDAALLEARLDQTVAIGRNRWAGVWICDAYLCGAPRDWITPRIEAWMRRQGREPHAREVNDWLKAAERRGAEGRLFCSDRRLSPQVAEDFQVAVQTADSNQEADNKDLTFEPHKHHLPAADYIIKEWYTDPATGTQTTIHNSTLGDFLWNGRYYQQLHSGDVVSRVVWRFGTHPKFRPSHAESITKAILARRLTSQLPPCWLDGSDRGHALVLANGIYCVDRREFIQHTPAFFAVCGAKFSYQPQATCDNWLRFLDSIWPGCERTKRELQKWFGYNLVPSYRYHKLALLVGAKRGGKGTICRILQAILGEGSYVTPSLYGLHERFALAAYVGKLAAIDPEIQFSKSLDPQALTVLKKITGDDEVEVEEKGMPRRHGVKLHTRFTLGSNCVVNFGDPSGAMVDRLLVFSFTESFAGREDHNLGEKLVRELPGIFNWALQGLDRLHEDGGFKQTPLGEIELEALRHSDSPIYSWASDCVVEDPTVWTSTKDLYASWVTWCADHRIEVKGSDRAFARHLKEAFPKILRRRGPRPEMIWGYEGLRLRGPGEEFREQPVSSTNREPSTQPSGAPIIASPIMGAEREQASSPSATNLLASESTPSAPIINGNAPIIMGALNHSDRNDLPALFPCSHYIPYPPEKKDKEREEGEDGGEKKKLSDNRKIMGTWEHPLNLPPAPAGKQLWVYDMEVFPDHVLVVLSDGRTWQEFTESSLPTLAGFLNDPGVALAGFNNHAYDDLLMRYIVSCGGACTAADLYRLSSRIINPQEPSETDANFRLQYDELPWAYSIDVFQLLNGKGSLKEWACRQGFELVAESPVDFNAPVPDDQVEAVRDYCRNDVLCTMRLLQQHWHLVELRTTLADRFRLGWRVYCLSEPKLAQHTFLTLHRQRTRESTTKVREAAQANPDNLARDFPLTQIISRRVTFSTPPFQRLLDSLRGGLAIGDDKGTSWSLVCANLDLSKPIGLAGRQFQFGVGGLHSVDGPGVFEATDTTALIDLDVTSYYPAIIITEGLHPQHLGPAFVADLAMVRDQRVAAKRAGDKAVADALKIVINSTFGKLNDAWSPLRSIPDALRVTVNGQLFLLMLIEALHTAGAEIVSANTDGVTIRWNRAAVDARLLDIIATWQQATAMELERTDFARLCRRDVNNYIALTTAGKVKSKGAFNPDSGKGDGAVIKKAVEAYLLRGIDPGSTIDAETDPSAFLFYQRAKNGGDLFHGNECLGKTARWYATTQGAAIRRQNPSGTWATIPHGHQARLALDITGWTRADLIDLDRQHYCDEAWKHIKEITG